MNKLWRALGGLCAAALVMVTILGAGAAPAQAEVCTELLADGGFEAGAVWQLGPSPVMPQYVTYTKHGGNRSLSLGITSGANVESFSSARQTVAIPAASPQVLLSFWFYAMADSPATTDYMEVVLLDATGSAILSKPWSSHNDSRVWNQMTFDLTSWRGQTVQLYFNVFNDGVGGRAAMFLDDVSLASCSGSTVVPTGTVTSTGSPVISTSTPSPTATPGCVDLLSNGGFDGGVAGWELQGDSAGITVVTDPMRSAPYALKLGSLDVVLNSLTSARQLVAVPAGSLVVTLEAWVYAQSQGGAGADFQQIALLNSSGGLLYVPWQAAANEGAWTRLSFDVSAFRGQNVFVRFAVNNDGIGGRTALYVDDMRLRACTPGTVATSTPTGTPVPTLTRTPTIPSATLTAVPPGCTEITVNGGFEAGYPPWQGGASSLPAQLVGEPVADGSYAMQLGSQTDNRNTYSSIRQAVTAPWGYSHVVVSFWAYTWAEVISGADRQQFVLLDQTGGVWAVPWSVLENELDWRQHVIDVAGTAGQSFSLYFNAINDGVGGRTALFVDEVHAWACTTDRYPASPESEDVKPDPPAVMTLPPAVMTLPPAVMTLPPAEARRSSTNAAAPEAELTRIALEVPTQLFAGSTLATETPVAGLKFKAEGGASSAATEILDRLRELTAQWPRGWPLLIVAIVVLLLLILAWGWSRR